MILSTELVLFILMVIAAMIWWWAGTRRKKDWSFLETAKDLGYLDDEKAEILRDASERTGKRDSDLALSKPYEWMDAFQTTHTRIKMLEHRGEKPDKNQLRKLYEEESRAQAKASAQADVVLQKRTKKLEATAERVLDETKKLGSDEWKLPDPKTRMKDDIEPPTLIRDPLDPPPGSKPK